MLLDIYPHNSLDDVMSQIAEQEVLKCLTYLALEQQVAEAFFFYRAVTLWNSLSNDLKHCESVNVFKRHLRSRLLLKNFRYLSHCSILSLIHNF